jgi:glutamyl-tRNA reductase
MLEFTGILICATSAPHILIAAEDVPMGKEMLLFDLAFPRDIDPALATREGIRLYDLEQIEQYARKNRSKRNDSISEAEQIIEEEIAKFNTWSNHLKHTAIP